MLRKNQIRTACKEGIIWIPSMLKRDADDPILIEPKGGGCDSDDELIPIIPLVPPKPLKRVTDRQWPN